jgi:hypothetical protein
MLYVRISSVVYPDLPETLFYTLILHFSWTNLSVIIYEA